MDVNGYLYDMNGFFALIGFHSGSPETEARIRWEK